jgi:antitoxin Xre/MbcA/ParS-like protein
LELSLFMRAVNHNSIFRNVPDKDYLCLFAKGEAYPSKVVHFVDLKKEEVARATGVPSNSIRYDERMPQVLKDRLREIATLLNLVAQFFEGDQEKTLLWFKTPNPMLGNISPRDMIRFGRYKKLLKFVQNAISENQI